MYLMTCRSSKDADQRVHLYVKQSGLSANVVTFVLSRPTCTIKYLSTWAPSEDSDRISLCVRAGWSAALLSISVKKLGSLAILRASKDSLLGARVFSDRSHNGSFVRHVYYIYLYLSESLKGMGTGSWEATLTKLFSPLAESFLKLTNCKRKALAPKRSKFFPCRVDPFWKGFSFLLE